MTANLRDYLNKVIPDALKGIENAWGAIKSGNALKELKIWARANWMFAVLSFLIASFLYFICRSNIGYPGGRTIPIELIIEKNAGLMFMAPSPASVQVSVNGTVADVRKFESNTDPIKLNVTAEKFAASGNRLAFNIKRKDIPGLKGIALKYDIKPNVVFVEGDTAADIEFFLNPPKIEGKAHRGDIVETDFTPKSIFVRGGRKMLESFRDDKNLRLNIEKVNVDGIDKDYETTSSIEKPEEFIKNGITFSNIPVRVTVKYQSRTGERIFKKLPVRISLPLGCTLPDGYKVEPSHVSAKLTGYDTSIETLSNALITAYAEIAGSTIDFTPDSTNTLPIKLEVPHDREIWVVEPDPATVKLILPPPPPPPVPAIVTNFVEIANPVSVTTNATTTTTSNDTPVTVPAANDDNRETDKHNNEKPKEN